MIFTRPMGSETEFGVSCPTRPGAHETILSALVVDSYPDAARQAGWDYAGETPLRDARGGRMEEEQAHPSQLTHRTRVLTSQDVARELIADSPQAADPRFWERTAMNRVLPDGARFYVDHAHPEYSAPETTHPWEALVRDAAGDLIAARAAQAVPARYGATWPDPVVLHKNNTDNKAVSYGYHENYLVPRRIDFSRIAAVMIPFLATRPVLVGAGRAGLGAQDVRPGFQISQRADFFERTIGLETTIRRPLVNTRDEPHADAARWRRLHVIPGDATLSHTSTLLKFASAAAVLTLIEQDAAPDLELAAPVQAMQLISRDPSLATRVELTDGRRLTGLEIQRIYAEAARERADVLGALQPRDEEIFRIWFEVLDGLTRDPLSQADRLDWVAKYALIRGYAERGIDVGHPKVQALDLQYADLRPQRSLYAKLVALGRMRTLVAQERIEEAVCTPPEDTRAWLRGRLIATWPDQVHSAGWEVLALRDPDTDRVHRWVVDDPLRGTRAETEHVLETSPSAVAALRRLGMQTLG
ncbi:depupylase/deamidase Dop [Rothia kristinae]|uniref:depupylase/deamidase Dop n=1 Tax=Rothia kristinae TaxID=37923 RepID=UPI0021B51DB1|nr:depupylase/deamidase Dop [Rothia kristinae]